MGSKRSLITKLYTLPFGAFTSTSNDLQMIRLHDAMQASKNMDQLLSSLILELSSDIVVTCPREITDACDVDLDHF